MTAPQPNQVEMLESPLCGVFSKAAYEKNGGKFDTVDKLVGTGPYVATEYKLGDSFSMTANPNYWNKDPNMAPKIKNILFRIITDPTQLAILAETGKADIVYDIAATDIDRIKANKKVVYMSALGTNTNYVVFNVKHKPLDNPKVREAIWYALNREAIVKGAYKSSGKLADGFFSPDMDGRHPDLSKFFVKQDVAKAKALLAEAGYANGGGIKINITTFNQVERVDMCEAIQAQLAEIGITVEVKNLPIPLRPRPLPTGKTTLRSMDSPQPRLKLAET